MFGQIELAEFKAATSMPQGAASAWSAVETSGLVVMLEVNEFGGVYAMVPSSIVDVIG